MFAEAAGMSGLGFDYSLSSYGQALSSYGSGGSGGSGVDANSVINSAFNSFNTFIQAKYAKDASKYAGGYYLGGESSGANQRYAPLTRTNSTTDATVPQATGQFAAQLTRFVQNNLGILAIGALFFFAWQRKPSRG